MSYIKGLRRKIPMPSVKFDLKGLRMDFNPLTWNLIFRPVTSLLASGLLTLALCILTLIMIWYSDVTFSVPKKYWFLVGLAVFVAVILDDEDTAENVPGTNYLALVTWLGMPLFIFRRTGKYGWTGKRLGFGRSKVVRPEFTDSEGFIPGGNIPFKVWNVAKRNAESRNIISAPAKNRSDVEGTLVLVLEMVQPKKTLDSTDPELDIGERARQEYRETVSRFVDTDVPSLQECVGDVLLGKKLVTAFISKSTEGLKDGQMVRDHGGNAMFEIIPDPKKEAEIVRSFAERVIQEGLPSMKKMVISRDDAGETVVRLSYVQVKKPITDVIHKLGQRIVRVTLGDLVFSEPVRKAANKASSEADERAAQIASAAANKAARAKLLPSKAELENPGWELATVLAASQDDKTNSIKVVLVPGSNNLTQAAVAAATQIGKGGQNEVK